LIRIDAPIDDDEGLEDDGYIIAICWTTNSVLSELRNNKSNLLDIQE